MKWFHRNNQLFRRLQARLLCLSYIVLCSFGALHHNHAASGVDADGVKQSCTWAGAHGATHLDRAPSDHATHCLYCDWQTNSVSPALPAVHFTGLGPHSTNVVAITCRVTTRTVRTGAARAPPHSA